MKVYLVGVSDCESNYTVCICSTKEIAERELFKERDRLIGEWKTQQNNSIKSIKEYCERNNKPIFIDKFYKEMTDNISSNDYVNWDNYPQECPYIKKSR